MIMEQNATPTPNLRLVTDEEISHLFVNVCSIGQASKILGIAKSAITDGLLNDPEFPPPYFIGNQKRFHVHQIEEYRELINFRANRCKDLLNALWLIGTDNKVVARAVGVFENRVISDWGSYPPPKYYAALFQFAAQKVNNLAKQVTEWIENPSSDINMDLLTEAQLADIRRDTDNLNAAYLLVFNEPLPVRERIAQGMIKSSAVGTLFNPGGELWVPSLVMNGYSLKTLLLNYTEVNKP